MAKRAQSQLKRKKEEMKQLSKSVTKTNNIKLNISSDFFLYLQKSKE